MIPEDWEARLDARINQWLDGGSLRIPALVTLLSLACLLFAGGVVSLSTAATVVLFDSHEFSTGQKSLVAGGWSLLFAAVLAAVWLRDRWAARRATAESEPTPPEAQPQERSPQRSRFVAWAWEHGLRVARGLAWLSIVATYATMMTVGSLVPFITLGIIDGYGALTAGQLAAIGLGWVAMWGVGIAVLRWRGFGSAVHTTSTDTA